MGGNTEKVIEALARRLPKASSRHVATAALRAAAEALPETQAKLKARLAKHEDDCVEKLLALLLEIKKEPLTAQHKQVELTPGEGPRATVTAAYDALTAEDLPARLSCCTSLLSQALCSLRPALRAEEAIEGLLVMEPPESALEALAEAETFDADALRGCARAIPLASAAMEPEDSHRARAFWHRFLAVQLLAPARLAGGGGKKAEAEAAASVGSLLALAARPEDARGALRVSLSTLAGTASAQLLSRLAPAALPLVSLGFGPGACEGDLARGDLVALLHALRFVCLCEAANAGSHHELGEASESLRAALEVAFDARTLVPELLRLATAYARGADSTTLRRRLAPEGKASKGRAAAASAVVETMEAVASSATPASVSRAADASGLPAREGEHVDQKAAVAKARGDIFFEDVGGTIEDKTLGKLDGVENLKPKSKKAQAKMESELEKGKKRPAPETAQEASPPSASPAGGPKKRLRRKSAAAGADAA